MVIDSVDTTMQYHRLTVDVERDTMRFFDFVFDVLDSPTICDLRRLMSCKRFEATHRLLKLDLKCGRRIQPKLLPGNRLEVFGKPIRSRLRIGGLSHGRIDKPL